MFFTRMKMNRAVTQPDPTYVTPYRAWGQGIFFAAVFAFVMVGFWGMVAGESFDFPGALEDHIDAIEARNIPCPIHDGMVLTLQGHRHIADPS